LKWLRTNGCLGKESTFYPMAYENLTILQLLHSQDCPWDEDTCYAVAVCYDLVRLQWLDISKGCLIIHGFTFWK